MHNFIYANYDVYGNTPIYNLNNHTVTNQNFYLDVQRRAASTSLPTSPTNPFLWDTLVSDTHRSHTLAAGTTLLPFDGTYSFVFLYNVDVASGTRAILSAAESFVGGVWTKLEFSCRQKAIRSTENNQALYASTNRFTANTLIRFPVWCDASGQTIITESPAAGFTIPAARMLITGIRS